MTDWAGRKSSLTHDLASHITGITRPNGSYRTISYDAAGQATNIMEQMSNSLPIAIFKFNWTNSGNMAWEFAAPLPHTPTVPTRTMTYDDDNRLATFNGSSVTSDLDGNLTSAPLTNSAIVSYTYDARNRLLNAGGVTNAYDAMNNRVGLTSGTNSTVLVVNPNTKLPQVLMRIKNGVTNYYIYGAGLLYQVTETATAINTLTYHYDYRGSTIALSSDSGQVVDRIEYSAYGLTTYRVGLTDTPFLFNGRFGVQTDASGLLYMRARYYNPYLCRFINPDPTGFAGGLNHYAYANGNPVSLVDPFGLGAVGESGGSSWLNTYNSFASVMVPGQSAWNDAQSAWQAGNYGMAALDTLNMIGQQVLFVATLGASSETTPMLNTANRALRLPATDSTLTGSQTLGYTTPNGSVFLQSGLSRAQQLSTLEHESVHAFFSPSGSGAIATFRQNFGQWGYNNSQVLRFTEEAIAETYSSGSLFQGLQHPLINGYGVTAGGLFLEGATIGGGVFGAGYFGSQMVGGN